MNVSAWIYTHGEQEKKLYGEQKNADLCAVSVWAGVGTCILNLPDKAQLRTDIHANMLV